MGVKFVDHGTAAAAIHASREYANYLIELAEALNHRAGQMNQIWQGESSHRFCEELTRLAWQLEQSHNQSMVAASKLDVGLDQARDAERRAEQEEERKRQQQQAAK